MRPSAAGLVNVHFPECTFVLDITLPTFGEYVSVGAGLVNMHSRRTLHPKEAQTPYS